MKKLSFFLLASIILLLGTTHLSHSQAPAWQMALATPGVSNNATGSFVSATAVDASGNVYVAGSFSGTLTLGNITLTGSSTGYPPDGFVAKWLPASGTFAWAARIASTPFPPPTGTFGFNNRIERLAVSGNSIYIGGSFEYSVSLGSTTLTNMGGSGTRDGFVAKLTDAGSSATWAWAQRLGGTGNDSVYGLATAGASVYVAGTFSGTATGFGPTSIVSAGGDDVFITKLTDAGSSTTTNWVQRLGGLGNDGTSKLLANGTTLYLAGTFSNTVDFGGTTLTSVGSTDGFVKKLTDMGSSASNGWTQTVGGTGSDAVLDAALSGSNLYLTGYFEATALLGTTTLVSAGASDGFAIKLTDEGSTSTYAWTQRLGGLRDDAGYRIATNGSKVYVAGQFGENGSNTAQASATFGNTTLQSLGGRDVFVTRLLDTGSTSSITWTQQAGSPNGDTVFGLALANTGLYIGGYFYGFSMAFGTQTLTNPNASGTASNGFFAALTDVTLPTRTTNLSDALRLYPNPAHTTVTVLVPAATGQLVATLTLTDALGRMIYATQPAPGTNYPLDLTNLAPGVYVVQVLAGETLTAQRLLVQ